MELIKSYLLEEALIIIPVLLIVGRIMKQTPKIRDWLIPYILLIFGIAFTIYLIGTNIDAILQGILLTGTAVYGNQLFKQTRGRNNR